MDGSQDQMGLLLFFKLTTGHTFQTLSEEHREELWASRFTPPFLLYSRSPSVYRGSYFAIGKICTYGSDLCSGTVADGKKKKKKGKIIGH